MTNSVSDVLFHGWESIIMPLDMYQGKTSSKSGFFIKVCHLEKWIDCVGITQFFYKNSDSVVSTEGFTTQQFRIWIF